MRTCRCGLIRIVIFDRNTVYHRHLRFLHCVSDLLECPSRWRIGGQQQDCETVMDVAHRRNGTTTRSKPLDPNGVLSTADPDVVLKKSQLSKGSAPCQRRLEKGNANAKYVFCLEITFAKPAGSRCARQTVATMARQKPNSINSLVTICDSVRFHASP